MLAVVYGSDEPEAMRGRLERIGRAVGRGRGEQVETYAEQGAAFMAWPGVAPVRLGAGVASVGDVRGALAPLESARRARGCFAAAALHDGELLLACSRSGGRPLFFAWEDEGRTLVACSELLPLVASMTPSPAASEERLVERLLGAAPADVHATPYAGVQRVGSSEVVVVRRTGRGAPLDAQAYGFAPLGEGAPVEGAPDDVADELRAIILRAVARAIEGTKRVAVLTGGGVDSSALLAAAIAESRGASAREVRAIAIDVGGVGDDRPYMAELTRAWGIVPRYVTAREGARAFAPAMVVDGAPARAWSVAYLHAMMHAARAMGADVALCGAGGDELFDGDYEVFAERAARGHVLDAVAGAARLRGVYWLPRPIERVDHLVLRPLLRRIVPAWARAHLRRALRRGPRDAGAPWYGPRLRGRVAGVSPSSEDGVRDVLLELAHERAQSELVSGLLRRDPLMDDDVLDFVARLPPELLFHGGVRRGLFRHAFRGMVPDRVRMRLDKSVATVGFLDVARGDGMAMLRSLSTMRLLAARGLVDAAAFAAQLEATAASDDPRHWKPLWTPLALEALLRTIEARAGERAPEVAA